jgi:signal peptidase I
VADSHPAGNEPDPGAQRSSADSSSRPEDYGWDDDGEHPDERPWRSKKDKPEKRGSLLREAVIIIGCVLLLTWLLQTFVGRQYVIPSESMEPTLHGCTGCTNDRIVIDKLSYRFGEPEPGDVVVFKAPTESWDGAWLSPRSDNAVVHKIQDGLSWFGFAPPDENNLVKRVIATGGQTVECRNSDNVGVTVDGKPLDEPYVDKSLQAQDVAAGNEFAANPNGQPNACFGPDFGPVKVPDGNVWVMGDNRANSADSRFHMEDEYQGTVPVSDIRGKVQFIIYPFSRIGGVSSDNPQS